LKALFNLFWEQCALKRDLGSSLIYIALTTTYFAFTLAAQAV